MNNVEKIFSESTGAEQFAEGYVNYLSGLLKRLDYAKIACAIGALEAARKDNKTVFVVGNGGSASTASHMANDIGMDVLKKSGTGQPFRIMALTDNVSLMTAIANDEGYDNLFVNQLKIYYRPGDTLIAISASGNSPNIIEAIEWVKARKGTVIGFVGFDGGRMKDMCDIAVCVNTPKGEYGPVEDVHMMLDHLISNWLLNKLSKEKKAFSVR